LTSLLYFVFFVVTLFPTLCGAPASLGLGTSTLETEGGERVSPLLVSPVRGVSSGAVFEELWDCDAEEALAGTADLGEEKK
jgi:hypothetical protein